MNINIAKDCPVLKNGKRIGRVVGTHQTDEALFIDFNLEDHDILGMYSLLIQYEKHDPREKQNETETI